MNALDARDFLYLLPLLLPAVGSLLALLVAAFRPGDRALAPLVLAVSAIGAIAATSWQGQPGNGTDELIFGMIALDAYTLYFCGLLLALLAGAAALGVSGWRAKDYAHGEYWALLLLSVTGMLLLAASTNLLLVFLGVELMSLSVYALVASDRTRSRPTEAALKYFLLGAFSSAALLFGIAFVYGATGSLDLSGIASAVSRGAGQRPEMYLGTAFLLAGFAFKTAAAPFHMWAPDAYTGAPTPVTAFMATAVKAASFAAFVRIFVAALVPSAWFWSDPLAAIAAATVIVGNVGALAQSEVKRLFAYSSVAHAGYILIGLRAASIDPQGATPAILFYLFAYGFTTLGTFAVVTSAERRMGRELVLDDLAGFASRHPWYAAAFTVFLLALAGVPPTAGFTAKLYVFAAAVRIGDYLLAVLGVLASAVSLYYYLRVVVYMYMRDPSAETAAGELPARAPAIHAVVAVAVLIVLLAGIAPDAYFRSAQGAAAAGRDAGTAQAHSALLPGP